MKLLAVALFALVAGIAFAHGVTGYSETGEALCLCTAETDDLGRLDPCTRAQVFVSPGWVSPHPAEDTVVLIAKLQRLIAALRAELANPPPKPP